MKEDKRTAVAQEVTKTEAEETAKTEASEEQAEKGFTAYLEIYGRSKMLMKVYDEFSGDPEELDDEDRESIAKYLENISGIPEPAIHHSVLTISPDEYTEEGA